MTQLPPTQDDNVQALSDQMTGTMAVLQWLIEALGEDENGNTEAGAMHGHLERAVESVSEALRLLGDDPDGIVLPKHQPGSRKATRRERKRAAEKARNARNARLRNESKKFKEEKRQRQQSKPHEKLEDLDTDLLGTTRCFAIPEILGLVSSLRKSGVFYAKNAWENFLLEFQHGSVVFAHGDSPPEGLRLGEILVSQGALTAERLAEFLEAHRDELDIMGVALVRRELITEEQLRKAVAFQVQHVVHRMYGSRTASFEFREGDSVAKSSDVKLNVTQLLLESARSLDEREAQVDAALAWLDGDDGESGLGLGDDAPDLDWFNEE